jgi:hypothetical protein
MSLRHPAPQLAGGPSPEHADSDVPLRLFMCMMAAALLAAAWRLLLHADTHAHHSHNHPRGYQPRHRKA